MSTKDSSLQKGANKETKNKRKWAGVINYRKNTTSICDIKYIYTLYSTCKYFWGDRSFIYISTIVVCDISFLMCIVLVIILFLDISKGQNLYHPFLTVSDN